MLCNFLTINSYFKSSSHSAADASLGMRQSPLGERVTEPTFGPSGRQLLLNCCVKKRLKKFLAAVMPSSHSSLLEGLFLDFTGFFSLVNPQL